MRAGRTGMAHVRGRAGLPRLSLERDEERLRAAAFKRRIHLRATRNDSLSDLTDNEPQRRSIYGNGSELSVASG
jgi:hypothetical protein